VVYLLSRRFSPQNLSILMTRFTTVALLVLFTSCQAGEKHEAGDLASAIVGRWAMEQVYDSGRDVTEQHDPSDNRWIEFTDEGSFISDGDPHGRNTGRWMLDKETQELYLDSDAGEGDDSYWIVSIAEDEMRWKGARSEFTERFEIVHARQ